MTTAQAVYFVDATLPDLATLLAGLPAGAPTHLLSAKGPLLVQVAQALDGRSGIEALHLITHGAPGQLCLGGHRTGLADLKTHRAELDVLSAALVEDGEWLIYGCDVGAGREGRAFINALTDMTGLRVAAASHKVGAAELGGSWELDVAAGMSAQALAVPQWQGVLPAPADGKYIQGDGSGGGGGVAGAGSLGGAGGGGDDTLTGTTGNDIIFGDGSGGGGGGGSGLFAGGLGGGGADVISGGDGNDILFGDGFNGAAGSYSAGDLRIGGAGGFGGGGGGGSFLAAAPSGGLGGGGGGTGTGKSVAAVQVPGFGLPGMNTSPRSGGNSATAYNETTTTAGVVGIGGAGDNTYPGFGGGGGGFGGAAGGLPLVPLVRVAVPGAQMFTPMQIPAAPFIHGW